MSERSKIVTEDHHEIPEYDAEAEPFDPFEEHFVSQNTKNDFLKALETKPRPD